MSRAFCYKELTWHDQYHCDNCIPWNYNWNNLKSGQYILLDVLYEMIRILKNSMQKSEIFGIVWRSLLLKVGIPLTGSWLTAIYHYKYLKSLRRIFQLIDCITILFPNYLPAELHRINCDLSGWKFHPKHHFVFRFWTLLQSIWTWKKLAITKWVHT